MVDSKGPLDAVRSQLTLEPDSTRVVDQHVQASMLLLELAGQLADLCLQRQVCKQCSHFLIAGLGPNPRQGGIDPGLVASDDHNESSLTCQLASSDKTD